jgi:hypothetical protein
MFLVKSGYPARGRNSISTVGRIAVRFGRNYKSRTRGGLRELHSPKLTRSRIQVLAGNDTARRGDGFEANRSWLRPEIAASAAAVKGLIRSMREDDLDRLAELDAELRDLMAREGALRDQMEEHVRSSWGRAHVVRLGDLVAQAEDEDPEAA